MFEREWLVLESTLHNIIVVGVFVAKFETSSWDFLARNGAGYGLGCVVKGRTLVLDREMAIAMTKKCEQVGEN